MELIGLIYQHYRHFDQLKGCLENLLQKVKCNQFVVSLWIDENLPCDEFYIVNKYCRLLGEKGIKFLLGGGNENRGITFARNSAISQFLRYADKVDPRIGKQKDKAIQYIECFTNSLWDIDLDQYWFERFKQNDGMSCYKFRNKDWLFERDDSLEKFPKVHFSAFQANQSRPDYLHVLKVSEDELKRLDTEYIDCKYTPEDVAWYLHCNDGYVNMHSEILAVCWFNSDGMTASSFEDMREQERNNAIAFYNKAEFFIDLFLQNKYPLTMQMLKFFTSSLVSSCVRSIPLKKYKNTIIFPLLMQRIQDWGLNQEHNNKFYMTEE